MFSFEMYQRRRDIHFQMQDKNDPNPGNFRNLMYLLSHHFSVVAVLVASERWLFDANKSTLMRFC